MNEEINKLIIAIFALTIIQAIIITLVGVNIIFYLFDKWRAKKAEEEADRLRAENESLKLEARSTRSLNDALATQLLGIPPRTKLAKPPVTGKTDPSKPQKEKTENILKTEGGGQAKNQRDN